MSDPAAVVTRQTVAQARMLAAELLTDPSGWVRVSRANMAAYLWTLAEYGEGVLSQEAGARVSVPDVPRAPAAVRAACASLGVVMDGSES